MCSSPLEFRSGTSDLPDAGIAGGSSHTATAGMAIYNAGADVIARLTELATNDQRSPLFGAGICRAPCWHQHWAIWVARRRPARSGASLRRSIHDTFTPIIWSTAV